MPKSKPTKKEYVPHERSNPAHPLLRELVSIDVKGNDGMMFLTLLTRVPGIGEEIIHEDRYYKVLRVMHAPVNDDGRSHCGTHAFVDAEQVPEDEPESKERRRPTSKQEPTKIQVSQPPIK